MPQQLHQLITMLKNRRVLVIGDIILDEYLIGQATRMSREAPVPVLEFESRKLIPGGAANPAANITALGSHAIQLAIVGEDEAADNLRNLLEEHGIEPALITDSARPTTVKTRIMAQMGLRFPQQVARLDKISRQAISESLEKRLIERVAEIIGGVDAVLLSDYHAGMLTPRLVAAVRDQATSIGAFLAADAQGQFQKYHRFGLVKCNADEARDFLRRDIAGDMGFAAAARELCQLLELTGGMVITRGARGATVATSDGTLAHCPAPAISDVYDTVGAGDTAITVMTLALIAEAAYPDAATLANYASGIVVRHVGNYTPTLEELSAALG